jgi:hypothetical protein
MLLMVRWANPSGPSIAWGANERSSMTSDVCPAGAPKLSAHPDVFNSHAADRVVLRSNSSVGFDHRGCVHGVSRSDADRMVGRPGLGVLAAQLGSSRSMALRKPVVPWGRDCPGRGPEGLAALSSHSPMRVASAGMIWMMVRRRSVAATPKAASRLRLRVCRTMMSGILATLRA